MDTLEAVLGWCFEFWPGVAMSGKCQKRELASKFTLAIEQELHLL
jgi:hypothetical protein